MIEIKGLDERLDVGVPRIQLAAPPALPKTEEQNQKKREIARISSGISYDFHWYSGWKQYWDNPNPVIRSPQFMAEGGYDILHTMAHKPHIYNILSILKDWLMSRKWEIRSANPKDERENLKAAFIAWQFDYIRQFTQKRRAMLTCYEYGRSITEMILGRQDVVIPEKTEKRNNKTRVITNGGTMKNAVVIQDLVTLVPTAFNFDKDGRLQITRKRRQSDEVLTQPWQYEQQNGFRTLTDKEAQHFLVLSHDPPFGWPEGTPLLVIMFWDYLQERAATVYNMIFAEKYSMDFLIGKYPAGQEGNVPTFIELVKGLQKNSWGVIPEELMIEFVQMASRNSSLDVYQSIIERCHGNMSEAALGHRGGVVSADKGSELGKEAVRQEKGEFYAQEFDGVINDQLIRRLCDWNFTNNNGMYPYIVTQVRPESDLTKEEFRFSGAYNKNIPFSRAQYMEVMGLLEPIDDDDIVLNMTGRPAKEDGENMENVPNSEQIPEMMPGEPGNNEMENRETP